QSVILLSQVPNDVASSAGLQGAFVSFFGPDWLSLLGVIVLTSLGTWGLPQMVQKFYAIKSEHDITIGAIVSTAFALIVAGGSYFLGGFGRLFGDVIEFTAAGTPVYDSIIPSMLANLPDLLVGIVVVLVLSASMSTLSSLVLTSSSTLTLDLIKGNIVKKMSDRSQLGTMRALVVVFIAISAGIALVQYHSTITFIAQLMGISWGALAGAFLAPFLYGLRSKRITKAAVWVSFIWGVCFTTANMFLKFIASPINCGAIAMLADLVIVPVVSLFTPRMDPAKVDYCFAAFHEKVLVERSQILEDPEKEKLAAD
ncbi:MAG: sodium:solute symporter, partial [Coriobacteriales bacterium]